MKDLYKTLEISENATEQEIKKAYRKLAKNYHPDVNKTKEAEEKFKEINAAYEVLSDKNKKAQYDRYGDQMFNQNNYAGHQQHSDDIFEQMFRASFGFNNQINLDRTVRVRVPLDKAIKGGKITIEGNTISFPKNISNGTKLRVKGKGKTFQGQTGDLYVQLVVVGDNNFEVNYNTIHTSVELNLKEAIFGTHKEINLYGDIIKIKIPKDIKYGQQLRIRGKGLHNDNMIVHCIYVLPKSDEIKESDLNFVK